MYKIPPGGGGGSIASSRPIRGNERSRTTARRQLRGSGPEVIKKSCCTKKTKIPANKNFLALTISDAVFIMLINVKIPTITVRILIFMSKIHFVLS